MLIIAVFTDFGDQEGDNISIQRVYIRVILENSHDYEY